VTVLWVHKSSSYHGRFQLAVSSFVVTKTWI